MHTIKPLDTQLIDRVAARCGTIVTAEDHSVIGGLGGAVAEHLPLHQAHRLNELASKDALVNRQAKSRCCELMELSSPHIVKAAQRAIQRK